jgi:hypothetical protein
MLTVDIDYERCQVCRRDPVARRRVDTTITDDVVRHLHPGHPLSIMGLHKVSGHVGVPYVKSGDELAETDRLVAEWDRQHGG